MKITRSAIKTVTRIPYTFGTNNLVFKDERNKVAHLDKHEDEDLVREMVPAVGGKIKCYVVKSLSHNDFIRITINSTAIETHIDNIPNLVYNDLNRLGKEFVWFLNAIYNNELAGTTIFSIIKNHPIPATFKDCIPDSWKSSVIEELTFTNYINIMYYISNTYAYGGNDTSSQAKIHDPFKTRDDNQFERFRPQSPFQKHQQRSNPFNTYFNVYVKESQQVLNHTDTNGDIIIPPFRIMSMLDKFNMIISKIPLNTEYTFLYNDKAAQLIVKKAYEDKDPIIVITRSAKLKNTYKVIIITKDVGLCELYNLDLNQPFIMAKKKKKKIKKDQYVYRKRRSNR